MENQKLQPFINLTIDKRKSLQKISERDDIVILKVDKSDNRRKRLYRKSRIPIKIEGRL